jgi:hypothetical protein
MVVDRVSDIERSECMKKGQCFGCKKTGHRIHNCPERKKKTPLWQTEVKDEEDEEIVRRIVEDF